MSIPEGAKFRIREVWDCNLHKEFAHISRLKDKFPNVSIDTEFPGVLSVPRVVASLDEHRYRTLKANVDNMKLIQLGLTLTNEHGNLPMIDGVYCAWQFNFRDFDISKDLYSPPSIDLLIKSGIDFTKNQRDGVDARKFGGYLVRYNLVFNRNVRYICFSGDYDFAYLLKILTGALLPISKAEFDGKVREFFGTVYDLKDMQSKHLLIQRGGLQNLANVLGVKRIGVAHQAGSDSLLTSSSFQKIKEIYLDKCKGGTPDVMLGLAKTKVF